MFFFFLRLTSDFFITKIPFVKNESVGIAGTYSLETLPPSILQQVSSGLTTIGPDGKPAPNLAKSWKISNDGKAYLFNLKNDVYFSDGTNLTSDLISYNFSDTKVERPDKYTIIFKLKDVYAPFLATVSRPILKKGFVGVGDYKVKDIKINGNFVESVSLVNRKNGIQTKFYHFYPSNEALKIAYMIGEVSQIQGVTDLNFDGSAFDKFTNSEIDKSVDYEKLVAIFYNTQDKVLSDKKIRNALSYAIPDQFSFGQRSDLPFSPFIWANQEGSFTNKQDFAHAKILLSAANNSATRSAIPTLEIKVFQKYKSPAEEIAREWKKIGIETKIDVVNTRPSIFQIFLGDFNVPPDPDQYSIWHSDQENNISNYKNLRIDKLLEDGRKTIDIDARKKIYSDFLKYFLDDSPASFLYFPYQYTITRK